jgi:hypothetical protein
MSTLDTKAIVRHFGGRIELFRKLNAHGHKISVKAIEKWTGRGNIPTPWMIKLIALSKAENNPITFENFIK